MHLYHVMEVCRKTNFYAKEKKNVLYCFRYDWKAFLKEYFLPVKGIRKFHHFRVTSKDPGFVYVKTSAPEAETRIKILKKEIPESAYPSSLPASGLSRDRAKYIYQTLRPLVRTAYQDATCPRPHEE